MQLPTRWVTLKASGDLIRINADDFDQARHVPADPPVAPAVPVAPPVAPVAPVTPPAPTGTLLAGGPTLEDYVAAGYDAATYPPQGYAEVPSPGLAAYRATATVPQAQPAFEGMTVAEIRSAVKTVDDVAALRASLKAEHARTEGARSTVVKAIEGRIAELTEGAGAQG